MLYKVSLKINLLPLEVNNSSLILHISTTLQNRLSAIVNTLDCPINPQLAYFQGRKQYHSSLLLNEAIKNTPNADGYVIVLTGLDVMVPIFTYVFGEAQLNGKYSIVSVFRLYEEFYTGRGDATLFRNRAIKEVFHELGHNFGLKHCRNWECVMHSSPGVDEIDLKLDEYCAECRMKIVISF